MVSLSNHEAVLTGRGAALHSPAVAQKNPALMHEGGVFNFQSACSAWSVPLRPMPARAPCPASRSSAPRAVPVRPADCSSFSSAPSARLAPPRPACPATPQSTNLSFSPVLSPSAPLPRTPVEGSCSRQSFLPTTEQSSSGEVSTTSTTLRATHEREKFSQEFFARDGVLRKVSVKICARRLTQRNDIRTYSKHKRRRRHRETFRLRS